MKNFLIIILFLIGWGLLSGGGAYLYVAESANYRIQSDSINFGGNLSTSSSYRMEDTLGEIATGYSATGTAPNIHAGYQAMQEIYLAVSTPPDVTLTPAINQLQGGRATGAATWTVTTDDPAGYTLSIRAGSDPAMKKDSDSLANYTPSGAADFDWAVSSGAAEFGMSPEGTHITANYRDNGGQCGVGSLDTPSACWAPVPSSATIIARSLSGTHPNGVLTRVQFQAEVTGQLPQGFYQAHLTVTAIAL